MKKPGVEVGLFVARIDGFESRFGGPISNQHHPLMRTERARDRCPQRSASTNGIGADSVLECVGTQESMMQAFRSILPGGWLHPTTSGSGERRGNRLMLPQSV
jgi:hypothetical protein